MYEKNKYRKYSMLARCATERAQKQYPEGELQRVRAQYQEIKAEKVTRDKMQRANIIGKRNSQNRGSNY